MLCSRHDISKERPETFDRFGIAFLCALSALLMFRQLASSSYFTIVVTDAFTYPSWAWQFKEALKEGVIYPRWMSLDFWGYGSPTFLLYPPLAYYMVALFNVLSGSIVAAMNIVKFISLFLSSTGIYFLAKEFYSNRVALSSAAFCLILPFNIALMYFFGSFAATVSCMWFPFILLFIHKFSRNGEYRYLALSGACYAGLILTHLAMAYMFTFVIAAFVICLAISKKRTAFICVLPVTLLIGCTLSAAYILPVMLERRYLNPEIFTTATNGFIYSNMFILPDMTSSFTDQGAFWPVHHDMMVLHTAIFCLLILIFLVRSMQLRKSPIDGHTDIINRLFLLTAFCSILLMFGISSFLWETIPLFKNILFPARWMHITAFTISFVSATLFSAPNPGNTGNFKYLIMPLALFTSCIVLDSFYIYNSPGYDEKKIFPAIAVNNVMEHLPRGVRIDSIDKRDDAEKEAKFTIQGRGNGTIASWRSTERIVDIKAENTVRVRFRTFNFPGWTAYVDGTQAEFSSENGTQAIMVNVPKGFHHVKLVFKDTPIRCCGKWISFVSLFLLTIFLVMDQFFGPKRDCQSQSVASRLLQGAKKW